MGGVGGGDAGGSSKSGEKLCRSEGFGFLREGESNGFFFEWEEYGREVETEGRGDGVAEADRQGEEEE